MTKEGIISGHPKFVVYIALCGSIAGCGSKTKSIREGLDGVKCLFSSCADGKKKQETQKIPETQPPVLSLTRYESCDDIQHDVNSQLVARELNERKRNAYYQNRSSDWNISPEMAKNSQATSAADASSTLDNAEASSFQASTSTFTNVQVKGVDESDFVKIGENHIFVVRGSGIEVVGRKDLRVIGTMSFEGDST